MFEQYNTLGFFNPFYEKKSSDKRFSLDPNDLLNPNKKYSIDNAALIEILSRGFCFGDRTIIKEIKKTPFFGKPDNNTEDWNYDELPLHCQQPINNYDEVGDKLFKLLKEEIVELIGNKKSVGILLSGGMDSRITAGALYECIRENRISANVLAITWGLNESRDVVYASTIAKRYGWEWRHFNIGPENLMENIIVTSEALCEFSPYNLHAMPKVAKLSGLDCIIASSYGDSIGRGVFSSRQLQQLVSYKPYIRNWFGLIEKNTFSKNKSVCIEDLNVVSKRFSKSEKYQELEVERLAHYMRRLLNPCMNVINRNIPVYQTFSSKKVISFMWQYDARYRNDDVYRSITKNNLKNISDIPWSKTGKPFLHSDKSADTYSKEYHQYGKWIKNELFDDIYSRCTSSFIEELGLINMEALKRLIRTNKRLNSTNITQIDTFTTWLASFSELLKKNNVIANPEGQSFSSKYISDTEFRISNSALIIKKLLK